MIEQLLQRLFADSCRIPNLHDLIGSLSFPRPPQVLQQDMRGKLRVRICSLLFNMIQSSGLKNYNQVCSGVEQVIRIGLVIGGDPWIVAE